MYCHTYRHRVRYRECDPMGVVYHTHYLDYEVRRADDPTLLVAGHTTLCFFDRVCPATLSRADLLDARLHKYDRMGVYEEVGVDGAVPTISNGEW